MTKPPSKRGAGRGKSPGKSTPAGTSRSPSAAPPRKGKPPGNRPGWMPTEHAPVAGARFPRTTAGASRSHDGHDPHAAREASRYEQPIASREMILQVLAANDGPMDADALAQKLALTAPDRFDALAKRLGAMLREGQVLQNRKGAYAPAERLDLIPGTVIANPEGFGF
ncbi:MAG: ribonuclease R, partial [Luteimonas sp.]